MQHRSHVHQLTSGMLHLRYDGTSQTIPLQALGLGHHSDSHEVKRAVARHLEVPPANLHPYVVDACPDGNMVLRPPAVFG